MMNVTRVTAHGIESQVEPDPAMWCILMPHGEATFRVHRDGCPAEALEWANRFYDRDDAFAFGDRLLRAPALNPCPCNCIELPIGLVPVTL